MSRKDNLAHLEHFAPLYAILTDAVKSSKAIHPCMPSKPLS